jgi:hypothetical protein
LDVIIAFAAASRQSAVEAPEYFFHIISCNWFSNLLIVPGRQKPVGMGYNRNFCVVGKSREQDASAPSDGFSVAKNHQPWLRNLSQLRKFKNRRTGFSRRRTDSKPSARCCERPHLEKRPKSCRTKLNSTPAPTSPMK